MYVERLLYPITVLGMGKRIGIWLQGCGHHCEGCINPELWEINPKSKIGAKAIAESIKKVCAENEVYGLTISGGEPFLQAKELIEVCVCAKELGLEILSYTGFLKEELLEMDECRELLQYIDVLIDGKYVDELNEHGLPLRGSSNQRIIFKDKDTEEKYREYLEGGRKLQNFYLKDYMLSIGIHDRPKEAEE